MKQAVGFVVIGRNESDRLGRCLETILKQSERLVYVDSESTDGSSALARQLGVRVVDLIAGKQLLTAARARNAGFAALREGFPECTLVQFIDGDCILADSWIKGGRKFLEDHPRVAVVCGRRFEAEPQRSVYNRILDEEWNTPVGPSEACGGDALMRVSAFDQSGGFRADFAAGEEPELCARMRAAGWEVYRLDLPMTEHDAAMISFRQWWRRSLRSGYGYAQAWTAAGLKNHLYTRQLLSAGTWVVGLPVAVAIAVIVARQPFLFGLIPLAYAAQLARIAARRNWKSAYSWQYAWLMMIAKGPELAGALSYFLARGQPTCGTSS